MMIVGVPGRMGVVMSFTRFMAVGMAMSVNVHGQRLLYEFAVVSAARRYGLLLESMTTRVPEFVDGSGNDCHHQKWPRTRRMQWRLWSEKNIDEDDQPNRQIEFLGCSWFHAHR